MTFGMRREDKVLEEKQSGDDESDPYEKECTMEGKLTAKVTEGLGSAGRRGELEGEVGGRGDGRGERREIGLVQRGGRRGRGGGGWRRGRRRGRG